MAAVPILPSSVDVVRRVILVEDDDADAYLVAELLAEAGHELPLVRASTLAEARPLLADADDATCVLVDLALPDAHGLQALHEVLALCGPAAVICLTGLVDEFRGVEAMTVGAQDYLVKGQVDGRLLARAMRYAVQRRRADEQARQLAATRARAEENARLERGLLPVPVVHDPWLQVTCRYRPGRQALLGGDFYDVLETGDGWLHVVIGDVAGHGPDEAALGVCLRIAWRTLVLAGLRGQELLAGVEEVLVRERRSEEVFTTMAMTAVAPDRSQALLWLAGHPAPLHGSDAATAQVAVPDHGPALGLIDGATWPLHRLPLGGSWRLMFFTDGLVEGFHGAGPARLGVTRLAGIVEEVVRAQPVPDPGDVLDHTLKHVQELNGGPLSDDVAMLLVEGRVP
ncbi:MAG: SpoIIE family protein phosphatase [Kineosporiaceae bacterium]